jgi:hypothetical protein
MEFGKIFKSKLSENWIKEFLLLRISRLRAGRTEFVIVLSGIREFAELKKKGKVTDLFQGLVIPIFAFFGGGLLALFPNLFPHIHLISNML